ncbi:tetratricopeptide repeat protein [Kribbella sp. NPDC058245]|uniref:tetratricopeptide repeat protein n=1 Tax=Kribbella sp. NPDC058245 TaxID=3346399 RepID=UPI0036E9039C
MAGARLRAGIAVASAWLLLCAVVGTLVILWLSSKPVDSAQVAGTVVAVIVAFAGGISALWRISGVTKRRQAIATLTTGSSMPRLPTLRDVDLAALGVRVPREGLQESTEQLRYVPRHLLDDRLRDALQEHRFVLVHGPSTAGKSRSVAELARELYPGERVVIPVLRPSALIELANAGVVRASVVVWLDDLDRHLGAGVDVACIERLLKIRNVRIIATMRAAAYEQIKPQGEARPAGRDVVELAVAQGAVIRFTGWDEQDRQTAGRQHQDKPDVVAALGKGMGLGEFLSAGPELIERLEIGDPPAEGVALVRAAADWFRLGLTRPVPLSLVMSLHPHYLPSDDALLLQRFEQALVWASTAVSGARLITNRTDGSGVVVHDYLLDYLSRNPSRPIPAATWQLVAAALRDTPADLAVVAAAALRLDDIGRAEDLARLAADRGNMEASHLVGAILCERKNFADAEPFCRAAAEAGYADAMHNLAIALDTLGKQENGLARRRESEQWLMAAATRGVAVAMHRVALNQWRRGSRRIAKDWLLKSIEAGHAPAMFTLAQLLRTTGRASEAEPWYRAAAGNGSAQAMNKLGVMAEQRGQSAAAEQWYRAGTEAGNVESAHNLADLLDRRGQPVEAEHYYRISAETGNTAAMNGLAFMLHERGDVAGARHWYHASAVRGDGHAMNSLAVMAKRRGDETQAEYWFHVGANAGDPDAQYNLALRLARGGKHRDAVRWYRTSARGGNVSAMYNLAHLILRISPYPAEAETWCREAAKAGHTAAMNTLGVILQRQGRPFEAERWFRRAAEQGQTQAIANLIPTLQDRGDLIGASRWRSRMDEIHTRPRGRALA